MTKLGLGRTFVRPSIFRSQIKFKKAYYDFKAVSSVGSLINATVGSYLIEKGIENNTPTKLSDIIRLNNIKNQFTPYSHKEKDCILWNADFELR